MDVKLGNLHIPEGLNLYFPRLAIHHDPELWGADVHEFKPKRFVDGIAKQAKTHLLLCLFCLGQGFVWDEDLLWRKKN